MRRLGIAFSLIIGLSHSLYVNSAETNHENLASALMQGNAHVNVRYRFENFADDRFAKDANASTARLRLNYTTGKWRNWTAFGEFDYVGEVFFNDFNSGAGTSSPSRNQYPTVADPNGADLNQLYFDYVGRTNTRLRIGRQRILLDDQRFVGGVGWRQNEQTYDGLSIQHKVSDQTQIFYSYITRINRIFGEQSAAGRHDTDTHLVNAQFKLDDLWTLTPFYYHIENDDAPSFSNSTVGVRISRNLDLGGPTLELLGTFATQSDVANNPNNFNADYIHASATVKFESNFSAGIGLEILEGDELTAGSAFRTPLATLHLFNGWADQFLATPDAGIKDLYVSAKYNYKKWRWQMIYHDFSAERGSIDWGTELDLSLSRGISDNLSLLLKGAFFDADDLSRADASKIWVQFIANY